MLPETHPLIESITKPLVDNAELKLSVAQILEQRFDPEHPSVPQAMGRLETQDKKKFSALGKIVLWVLAVTGLGLGIYSDVRSILRVAEAHDFELLEDIELPPQQTKYTPQEQLLLDDPEIDDLTEKKRLFESDPNNPAYFAEYAWEYRFEHKSLPPDFLETAKRIDPENAFFLYLAAADVGTKAVASKRVIRPKLPDRIVAGVKLIPLPTEQEYAITDQAAYESALELFKKASQLPEFRTYTNRMTASKARHISTDNIASYESGYGFYYLTMSCGVEQIYNLIFIISARAEELSKSGRNEEFVEFSAQFKALLSGLSNNDDINVLNESITWFIVFTSIVNLQAGSERLDLKEVDDVYRRQRDEFIADRDRLHIGERNFEDSFPVNRMSHLGRPLNVGIHQSTKTPLPIQDFYIKPMRLVEHELFGRFGVLAVSACLLIGSLVVFAFRFLSPHAIRLPSKRIASLLGVSDWIWIFILGIALPILVFLYISRLSPMSGRDFSCSHFEFAFPGIHLIALLLTLLLAPAIVTRWRLVRRTAAFKFGSRLDLLALPVIGIMLVYAIIAYPVLMHFRLNDPLEFAIMLPPLGWLAFVFFNGLRIFLGSAGSRIIQTATAIAVLPAYPLAILALCLTLPLYINAERRGLAEDKRIFIDPETSELVAYEFKVAAQKRKEINEILGF